MVMLLPLHLIEEIRKKRIKTKNNRNWNQNAHVSLKEQFIEL